MYKCPKCGATEFFTYSEVPTRINARGQVVEYNTSDALLCDEKLTCTACGHKEWSSAFETEEVPHVASQS